LEATESNLINHTEEFVPVEDDSSDGDVDYDQGTRKSAVSTINTITSRVQSYKEVEMSFGDDDRSSEQQIKNPVSKLLQSSRFKIEEEDESNADEM